MTTELTAALIGASAGGMLYLMAIVIRTVLANRSEHNVTRHESRVKFLESQISELYGPPCGLHE